MNWRTLAKPAANATSVNGRSVVSISSRAVWARWARARASGPAPSSVDEQAVEVALAVAEPGGEPGDALAVDDAVGDEPHRPADDVGADVPLGEPGVASGRQRLQARKPAPLGGGRRREERTLARFGVTAGQHGRQ